MKSFIHEFCSSSSLIFTDVRATIVIWWKDREWQELEILFIGHPFGSSTVKHCDLDNARCFTFRVKTRTAAKYGLSAHPRLVDIIAAVPPQYRKVLVPKLKAKPIRTASGVSDSNHEIMVMYWFCQKSLPPCDTQVVRWRWGIQLICTLWYVLK